MVDRITGETGADLLFSATQRAVEQLTGSERRSASFGRGEPFAVIRQRDRSDHDYPGIGHFPDIGQQMTWRLWWEHTSMLVEEAHGGADADITEISRAEAGQITAGLAVCSWPPDAARLPWVASAYPR